MRLRLLWAWTAVCAIGWAGFLFWAISDRNMALGALAVLVIWVAVGVPLGGRYRP